MRINHNIAALNTYRQLNINTTAGSKSLEKLSSGFRINRAGDDAAGLAISEKMRGQIRGLNQAERNSQDAISLIQTAEGALNETHSILQRMRELAVQSASDTNTNDDRAEIQKEIDQLTTEIKRISTDTEFNTKKLLNGGIANTATLTPTNGILSASVADGKIAEGDYKLAVSDVEVKYEGLDPGITSIFKIEAGTDPIGIGIYTLNLTEVEEDTFDAVLTDASGSVIATKQQVINNNGKTDSLDIGGIKFNWIASTLAGFSTVRAGTAIAAVSMDATFKLTGPDGVEGDEVEIISNTTGSVTVDGLQIDFDQNLAAQVDTAIDVEINELTFQIGANERQEVMLGLGDMSAVGLGVDGIDLSSQATVV